MVALYWRLNEKGRDVRPLVNSKIFSLLLKYSLKCELGDGGVGLQLTDRLGARFMELSAVYSIRGETILSLKKLIGEKYLKSACYAWCYEGGACLFLK